MAMLKMDLSFLFWEIAGIFSLGLVSVFYTMPYREFAKAGLYEVLRQNALADGVCDSTELPVLRRIWAYKCRIYEIFRKKLWFC